jgi:hypothetical protein
MVISGIMSFVSNECDLRKEYELHDTKLIIDGHYLQWNLHRLSSAQQKDYIYSTDYTTHAETIRRFLRRLNICKIVPIIVYDGSINPEKYKTCFDDRIKEIKIIQRNGYNCKFQSPTLANYVFASVMREFGVDIIETNSETLAQIVSLANQLKYLLMLDKIDFIVFDSFKTCVKENNKIRNSFYESVIYKLLLLSYYLLVEFVNFSKMQVISIIVELTYTLYTTRQ